jgi:hypothetical protein
MSDSTAPPNVVIVPCKYKTGRELGRGTYAVVKGKCVYAWMTQHYQSY